MASEAAQRASSAPLVAPPEAPKEPLAAIGESSCLSGVPGLPEMRGRTGFAGVLSAEAMPRGSMSEA